MLKRIPLHPFLFAVYPVLALLGHNVREASVNAAMRPLVVALLGAALLFLAARLLLRSALKAGLVTSLCLLLFFTYGHVYTLLKESPLVSAGLARHRLLLPVYAGLLALGLVAIWKGSRARLAANQALNLMGAVLLVFPMVQTGGYLLTTAGQPLARQWVPQKSLALSAAPQDRPDVYYIILDGYSRLDVIRDQLGYDNSAFVEQLQELGFVVAGCSRSNYSYTKASLASSLNMEFMPALIEQAQVQGLPPEDVWTAIAQSQARRQFEALGYRIVAFDSGYAWSRIEDADLYLSRAATPYGVEWITPFEKMLVDSTLASLYTDWQAQAYRSRFSEGDHPQSYFIHQETFKLVELPKVAAIEEPTFTFAHILIPHVPFVFSAEGLLTDPGYFDGELTGPVDAEHFRSGYVHEIEFANQEMVRILAEIIQGSSTPPVIVLQGDHGFGDDKLPILNAYYLPGEGRGKVYPSISPVNTFRLIFDAYFGGAYGLLPDESFLGEEFTQPIPESGEACR